MKFLQSRCSCVILMIQLIKISARHPKPRHAQDRKGGERFDGNCLYPPKPDTTVEECASDMPRLFKAHHLEECGFPRTGVPENYIRYHTDPTSDLCRKHTCLLAKATMIKNNTSLDFKRLRVYFDMWVKKYPSFKPTVVKIKKLCFVKERPWNLTGTAVKSNDCPSAKLIRCILPKITFAEAVWKTDISCERLRQFLLACSTLGFFH